jgi:hypothetical protein
MLPRPDGTRRWLGSCNRLLGSGLLEAGIQHEPAATPVHEHIYARNRTIIEPKGAFKAVPRKGNVVDAARFREPPAPH